VPFIPEYPHADYDHKSLKRAVVYSIIQAFQLYMGKHGLDIKYSARNEVYYITRDGKVIATDFESRIDACYWILEGGWEA